MVGNARLLSLKRLGDDEPQCAATFAMQVVASSDHVRLVWLHPQDPQGGVAQRRAEDGRLVFDVSAGKRDTHLKLPRFHPVRAQCC